MNGKKIAILIVGLITIITLIVSNVMNLNAHKSFFASQNEIAMANIVGNIAFALVVICLIVSLYTIQSDCKAAGKKSGLWMALAFFLGPIGSLIYVFANLKEDNR